MGFSSRLRAGASIRTIAGAVVLVTAVGCVPDGGGTGGTTTTAAPTSTTTTTVATTTTTTTTTTTPSGGVQPPTGNRSIALGTSGLPTDADESDMTPDGRYVVFTSKSSDLVPGIVPLAPIVYRLDRLTNTYAAACLMPDGTVPQKNGPFFSYCEHPTISADGRYASYDSNARLDSRSNGGTDVFVTDFTTGTTVDVAFSGNNENRYPSISNNGRWVVFRSASTNLVTTADTNGETDTYRWDRTTGEIRRVSVAAGGGETDGGSSSGIALDDGRVAFNSNAKNLIPGQTFTGSVNRTYLRNLDTGAVTAISVANGSVYEGYLIDVTPDGRYVLFNSSVRVLPIDNNSGQQDTYLRDVVAGTTTLGLPATNGESPSVGARVMDISSDGRFMLGFSGSSSIVPGDTNSAADVFLVDRSNGSIIRVSRNSSGGQNQYGVSSAGSITDDGRTFTMHGAASELLTGSSGSLTKGVIAPTNRP